MTNNNMKPKVMCEKGDKRKKKKKQFIRVLKCCLKLKYSLPQKIVVTASQEMSQSPNHCID